MKGAPLFRQFVLVLFLVSSFGCSGSVERDPTVPVSGTVTFNGQPVAGANVTFIPASGRPATGITDDSGVYKLKTFEENDGAVVGSHKVTISKSSAPAGNSAEELKSMKSELPEKYNNPESSGLTAEVKEGQDTPIDFKLEG